MKSEYSTFLDRFLKLEPGHRFVIFDRRRYNMTVTVSADGKRRKLYAEELGGSDHISFNLYLLDNSKSLLKPCEMPMEKVVRFINSFEETVV